MLILGGTAEAVELAAGCAAVPRFRIITSLAGRTRAPTAPPGEVRVGGFGGADGLAEFLGTCAIDRVVDATHPFAVRMAGMPSRRVGLCACRASVCCARLGSASPATAGSWSRTLRRPPLPARARRTGLPDRGQRDLEAFAGLDQWLWCARSSGPPDWPLRNACWLSARGPFRVEDEILLLRAHAIDVLVTKASGGDATYAKLAAARALGLPVIMVRRPPPPPGPVVDSVGAALAWLDHEAPAEAGRLLGRST